MQVFRIVKVLIVSVLEILRTRQNYVSIDMPRETTIGRLKLIDADYSVEKVSFGQRVIIHGKSYQRMLWRLSPTLFI